MSGLIRNFFQMLFGSEPVNQNRVLNSYVYFRQPIAFAYISSDLLCLVMLKYLAAINLLYTLSFQQTLAPLSKGR